MAARRVIALLLIGLVALAFLQQAVQEAAPATSSVSIWRHLAWIGFLFWLPLILASFLLGKARWVLMASVMYGTIGLALDISTIVQALTSSGQQPRILVMSVATGLLNFLLIVLGGRGFLEVNPAVPLEEKPPGSPPPNPPSPSAT